MSPFPSAGNVTRYFAVPKSTCKYYGAHAYEPDVTVEKVEVFIAAPGLEMTRRPPRLQLIRIFYSLSC